jgi:hypothetical protein
VPYLLFIPFILIAIYYYLDQDNEIQRIKRNGVSVVGTIIHNKESGAKSMYRLGGNINDPTIKFFTEDGEEIIGNPIVGFISQQEVAVPSNVNVIYDRKDPKRFCIDIS